MPGDSGGDRHGNQAGLCAFPLTSAVTDRDVGLRYAYCPASLLPMADGTGAPPDAPLAAMPPPGTIARALLRAAGSTAVLVVIYSLLPLDHSARWLAITMLAVGLAALVGLISFQVHAIIASRYPGLRALEALATSVPLF